MPVFGIRVLLSQRNCFAVAACNNIWQIPQIGWGWLSVPYHIVKPLISVAAMAVVVLGCYAGLLAVSGSNGLSTLIAIAVGGTAYFVVLLAIGGVSLEIIRKVPKVGNKLAALLLKLKLVRE